MRLIEITEMDHFWVEKRRQKIEGSLMFDTRKPGTNGNNGGFG